MPPRLGGLPPDDKRCVNPSLTSPDGRCRNWRREFGTQCAIHGNAPQVQNAVQRREAEAVARKRALQRLEREGYPTISGPEAVIEILEERLSVQVAFSRALDTIVRKLADEDTIRYEHRAGEQLRGEIVAWLKINEQVAKLGNDYLRIGLDERKVRISEAQAAILIGVIQAVAARLDLTSVQRKILATAVPEELERIAIEGQK